MLERFRAQWIVLSVYLLAAGVSLLLGWSVSGWHPLLVAAIADLAATGVVFVFSAALNNSSVYDPFWSVAPIPIGLYWSWAALETGTFSIRSIALLLLILVWGARLTFNWLARWTGLSDEDFRYREIRERSGRWYWPVSFFTIHLFPTCWVFLGLLAAYPGFSGGVRPLGALDGLAFLITAAAIVIEWLADRQLRQHIRSGRAGEETLTRGLWAHSRHPNYLGEVMFWWGLYLFGLAADPGWWWSVFGPLSITGLFVFVSVPWMDRRMQKRKPDYARLTRHIPGLFPWKRFWPKSP